MLNSKEFNEILSILKEMIQTEEIQITQEMFDIEQLKYLIVSNPKFLSEILSLKEKARMKYERNKNVLNMISNIHKKQNKECKVILNHLPMNTMLKINFSLFYNEPGYIEMLNRNIYQRILENLTEYHKECKLVSVINGNFSEGILTLKDKAVGIHQKNSNLLLHPGILLEEMYSCKNSNLTHFPNLPFKIKLKSHDITQLKEIYSNLITNFYTTDEETLNAKKRRETIQKLIQENKKSQLVELLKLGIPPSLRRSVYLFLMGVETTQPGDKAHIEDNIFILDYIILNDAHKAVSNENYFLFEDNLIKVLSQMIRDEDFLHEIQGIRPLIVLGFKSTWNTQSIFYSPYPVSGLFPFPGIAHQCGCFCYMSTSIEHVYLVTKYFYCKYLSYTSSFTTNKNSLLALIYGFHLIFSTSLVFLDLYKHLQKIHCDINNDVLGWYMTSFAGVITPDNVFFLYDMIILSDSLQVFILFSLAILYWKMSELMSLFTAEDVRKSLENLRYENISSLELMNALIGII